MSPRMNKEVETIRSFSLLGVIAVLSLVIGIGVGYMLNTAALDAAKKNAVDTYAQLMYDTCFKQEKTLGENGQRARRACEYLKNTEE